MNLAPLFLLELGKMFVVHRNPAGWEGPEGSLCPGLWPLFTQGSLEAPAEKEGGEIFSFLNPDSPLCAILLGGLISR
jgi:hypothetical protein